MQLKELKENKDYQVRKVSSMYVSKYANAMRNGANFPPIVVDQHKNIICGNTRYQSYMQVYDTDHDVPVTVQKFKTHSERLIFAALDNDTHGYAITRFDKLELTHRLVELGNSRKEMERILFLSVKDLKIEKNSEGTYEVVCGTGTLPMVPSKHKVTQEVEDVVNPGDVMVSLKDGTVMFRAPKSGFEFLAGKTISESDWIYHRDHHPGTGYGNIVNQYCKFISDIIDRGWCNHLPEEQLNNLSILRDKLNNIKEL